jgi:hypothetical protein
MEGPINVYHRATFETFSYGEESAKGPTPMAAFRFIKHLFAPFEEELTKCSCRFNARHVESITPAMYTSFLSIASSLDRDDKLSFTLSGNLFRDPLQELRMIQFHPCIQLKIEPNFGYDLNVTKKELMDIARDFHHLYHWPVGDFPCLVANSLVESLHLSRHNNGPGWSESVAELSQNQIVKKLSVEFTNSKSLDEVAALVKSVLAGHKSLEHLSITAEFESGEQKRFVDRFPGAMSRTLSTKLNRCGSDLQVGLAYFGLTCIGRAPSACGLRSPRHWKVKCDGFWDNSISPWLVCNWLHMMQGKSNRILKFLSYYQLNLLESPPKR